MADMGRVCGVLRQRRSAFSQQVLKSRAEMVRTEMASQQGLDRNSFDAATLKAFHDKASWPFLCLRTGFTQYMRRGVRMVGLGWCICCMDLASCCAM